MFKEFDFLGFNADPRIVIYANLGLAEILSNGLVRKASPETDAYLVFSAENKYEAKVRLNFGGSKLEFTSQGVDPYITLNSLFFRLERAINPSMDTFRFDSTQDPFVAPNSRTQQSKHRSHDWDRAARASQPKNKVQNA